MQDSDAVLVVRGDSVLLLRDSVRYAAETPGVPDQGPRSIAWTSSDSAVVSVDRDGLAHARRIGTATLTVTLTAPDLLSPITRSWPVRVTYAAIAVDRIDSLTGLGERRSILVRGLDVFGTPDSVVPAVLASRDTSIVSVVQGGVIEARGTGVATLVALFGAQRDSVPVRVRRVAASASFGVPAVVLPAVGRDTVIALQVRDTNDSLIAAPSVRWTSSDPSAISVGAQGSLRALRVAPALLTAQIDTVTATVPVTVNQVVGGVEVNGGDAQISTVGALVPVPPSVTVRDGAGYPIAGVDVAFSVSEGGGTITDSVQTTGADGIATLGSWTLGTRPGINRLLARVGGTAIAITATAAPGAADPATSEIVVAHDQVAAGDTTGITLYARDAYGNASPTVGAVVAFRTSGGTTAGRIGPTLDLGNGTYAATFTGLTAGSPATVTATIDGTPVSSPLPSVIVVPGPPARLTVLAGDGQEAPAGTAVGVPPAVAVYDTFDNPVAGTAVSFAVAAGGGSVAGSLQTTDHLGQARVASWTLGPRAGENRLTVSAEGLPAATVTATGVPGTVSPATSEVRVSMSRVPAGSTAVVTFQARDSLHNPITTGGAVVVFTLAGGTSGGEFGEVTDRGDGTYTATFTGRRAGSPATVGASVNGAPVTADLPVVTVVAGAPARLAVIAGNDQQATVGTAVPVAPTVSLWDAMDNPVPGAIVTFEITGGEGTVTDGRQVSDSAGRARVGAWTLGPTAGEQHLTARVETAQATFTAIATPGPISPEASLVTVPQDTVAVGDRIEVFLRVYDAFGNRARTEGVTVTFFLEGGTSGGTFGPTADRGDGLYVATFTGVTPGTPAFVRALVGDAEPATPSPTLTVRGNGVRWTDR